MPDFLTWLLFNLGINQSQKIQETSIPAPIMEQQQTKDPLEELIIRGLSRYADGSAPIATLSAQLAKAGHQIEKAGGDPLLPTITALKESGGGKKQAGINNPYGTKGLQDGKYQFINYSTPEEALFGGTEAHPLGFTGNILKNYQTYLKSGNLKDLFSKYASEKDPRNPSIKNQENLYNQLRSNFY